MTKIRYLTRDNWTELSRDTEKVMNLVDSGPCVVKSYMSPHSVMSIRNYCFYLSLITDPAWHPLMDSCPDYHRIHENFPKAHVRSVQHGFYFHTWNQNFRNFIKIDEIAEIFSLKARLSGLDAGAFLNGQASMGPVARLVVHQYPSGGGGQDEHIDPVQSFARIQTIIQASQPGVDYQIGGLYARDSDGARISIDEATSIGDLIVMSPGVKHGVDPVDPKDEINWQLASGRWIILPIILHSDHFTGSVDRPRKVD